MTLLLQTYTHQLRNTLTSKSLKEITNAWTDLELTLKPSKSISMVYNGKEMDKTISFVVGAGSTRNISSGPTKFLGQIQSSSISLNSREARKSTGPFSTKGWIIQIKYTFMVVQIVDILWARSSVAGMARFQDGGSNQLAYSRRYHRWGKNTSI